MAQLWDKYFSTDQFDGGSLPMDIAPSYNFGTNSTFYIKTTHLERSRSWFSETIGELECVVREHL
jgi:hypothetical protein